MPVTRGSSPDGANSICSARMNKDCKIFVFFCFVIPVYSLFCQIWITCKNGILSGLLKKVEHFQKWPHDGINSGYAHLHSCTENRWFYTECIFIFYLCLLPKKYLLHCSRVGIFFVSSRACKKQMIFDVEMTSSSIVPHLTYRLLIVSIGGR